MNLGTVKSRLMRGRAHLKARLAPLVRASGKASSSAPVCSSNGKRAPLAGLREVK
jgi:RNA polymerase sigma-70 factor (ECF subfamily)